MISFMNFNYIKLISLLIFVFFSFFVESRNVFIKTDKGFVRGYEQKNVFVWKGIPYAAAPKGQLRWKSPQEHSPWNDELNATKFGYSCPQIDLARTRFIKEDQWNEDCLSLNIWSPKQIDDKDELLLPVMVWIHGGAFIQGGASDINGNK